LRLGSRLTRPPVALGLLLGILLTASGCEDAPSILQPRANEAAEIRNLAIILLAICGAIFLIVQAWLIYNIVRYRRRSAEEPVQDHGDIRMELTWTVIPILIVIVIFILTVNYMDVLTNPPSNMEIDVTGRQWWWEISYPAADFSTANEFYVPIDETVRARLEAADVIHSFWMPQIGGKTDMIPGHTNQSTFTITQEGEYLGECGEFCGVQHAHMRFLIFAVDAAAFSQWVEQQQQPAAAAEGEQAQAGEALFLSAGCGGCHTVRGLEGAAGLAGPDLTHVAGRTSLAAVTLDNTPENLARWIDKPQAVKPGNLMPEVAVSVDEIQALVAYLEGLE